MWSPTQFGQGQSCISGLVIDSCRAVRHDSDTLYGNQTQVARDQIQQHWIRTSLLLVKLRAHTRQMVAGRFQMSSLAAEVREGCMVLASTHENCEMATNYLGLLGLVLEPNGNCFWRRCGSIGTAGSICSLALCAGPGVIQRSACAKTWSFNRLRMASRRGQISAEQAHQNRRGATSASTS